MLKELPEQFAASGSGEGEGVEVGCVFGAEDDVDVPEDPTTLLMR